MYSYKVILTLDNAGKVTVIDQELKAVLLFNPWNSGKEFRPSLHTAAHTKQRRELSPSLLEDACYYSTTSDLSEYVLNNQGRIWVGNADSNYGRPWQFAQFTPQALEVAMYVLSTLPKRDRGDPIKVCTALSSSRHVYHLSVSLPVQVSRHLSALVNTQDENGILVGNWSGDYSGGESPLKWTGSAEILARFARTRRPVKYAQCWVFSGVQTTCKPSP